MAAFSDTTTSRTNYCQHFLWNLIMTNPVLYSFRRCPYAMRARLAMYYAQSQVELREIVLKNKPQEPPPMPVLQGSHTANAMPPRQRRSRSFPRRSETTTLPWRCRRRLCRSPAHRVSTSASASSGTQWHPENFLELDTHFAFLCYFLGWQAE